MEIQLKLHHTDAQTHSHNDTLNGLMHANGKEIKVEFCCVLKVVWPLFSFPRAPIVIIFRIHIYKF